MKSQVFTTAWQKVKSMGISFGYALRLAWLDIKIQMLQSQINELDGIAFSYSQSKPLRAKQNELIGQLNAINPCFVFFGKPNMDGAKYDYGCGKYNGD
jgi:hypothetical protein